MKHITEQNNYNPNKVSTMIDMTFSFYQRISSSSIKKSRSILWDIPNVNSTGSFNR
jgi:hypothetical protein